ncbi:MAG: hypothetical protein EYC70_09195 [Planctomycetota bacterium]|nr:MAG: hypothetical protein EYC70_09195 [Planctomycetota bacterium]
MGTLYTHLDLNVDAAASIWLWRRAHSPDPWPVKTVPSTWDGSAIGPGDVALDMDAGGRGIRSRRNQDGSVSSCFHVILNEFLPEDGPLAEHEELLRPLADILDAQRRDGNLTRLGFPPRYGIYGLTGTFLALKLTCAQPEDLLDHFSRILDGFVRMAELSDEVGRLAQEIEFIGDVAVILDQNHLGLHRAVFRRGARFLIFRDGNNLGILREARERAHLGRLLEGQIQEAGWFFHPRGHLAARGTRKAPAATASRYEAHAIARMLDAALKRSGDLVPW